MTGGREKTGVGGRFARNNRVMFRRLILCLLSVFGGLVPGLPVPGPGASGVALARAAHLPANPPSGAAPAPAPAPSTPPAMCEAAIGAAEAEAKLPARVLLSISIRESGRKDPETGRTRPWPWVINYEGSGRYFASKAEAIAAVQEIQAMGGQSIDVGCMQVNLMHHASAFSTLDEAFDPARNAAYAARFLRSLFASTGDWGKAIGGYHSRTPGRSEAYRDQVVATWNPTDPAVLSRLTLNPAPVASLSLVSPSSLYIPFARSGPIQMTSNLTYRAFSPSTNVYRSFRPMNVAYADFSRKPARSAGRPVGRPLDLRLSLGGVGTGRGLVVPNGVASPGVAKGAKTPVPKRGREAG